MELADRFKGCFLGLAAGDALGMPVEGLAAHEIREMVGKVKDMMPAPQGHFHSGLEAGQYTDDTEETLILAESLLECSGFSAECFAEKLMSWGSSWILDEGLNRGVGFTTRTSVESMLRGISWRESGLDLPTCGSAMRVAPVGLLYHPDLTLVSRYAELQSLPTHSGPAARAGSIAVAVGVALSLQGFPKETILRTASALARRADEVLADRLLRAGSLSSDPEEALAEIGTSPAVYEAVPAAFYCFLRFGPEEALMVGASGGGDTDSVASIAGALAGAACGTSWIPERWLSILEDRERLERTAQNLAELSASFTLGRGEFISAGRGESV